MLGQVQQSPGRCATLVERRRARRPLLIPRRRSVYRFLFKVSVVEKVPSCAPQLNKDRCPASASTTATGIRRVLCVDLTPDALILARRPTPLSTKACDGGTLGRRRLHGEVGGLFPDRRKVSYPPTCRRWYLPEGAVRFQVLPMGAQVPLTTCFVEVSARHERDAVPWNEALTMSTSPNEVGKVTR